MPSKTDIWMPLYIGDYLADTADLSTEQHGAYLLLLMHQWRVGPLADDMPSLCRVCRMDASSTSQALLKQVLSRFFKRSDDGLFVTWVQGRLEIERDKWTEKKRVYIERASKGGRAKAASSTASSTASSVLQGVLETCTPPSPLPLPVFSGPKVPLVVIERLILNDGSEFPLNRDHLEECQALYPAVDVEQQFHEMRGWCIGNPKKRKTKDGALRFVHSWLSKAQNDSSRNGGKSNGRARGNGIFDDLQKLSEQNGGNHNSDTVTPSAPR